MPYDELLIQYRPWQRYRPSNLGMTQEWIVAANELQRCYSKVASGANVHCANTSLNTDLKKLTQSQLEYLNRIKL